MNPMDDLLADMAAKTPAANLLVPVQTPGADVGLDAERVLVFKADLDTLEKITLNEYEGFFVFEHYADADVKFTYRAVRSDDPLLMDAAENYLRTLGYTMQYPTPDDHKWLDPSQFERMKVPEQWQCFFDESSGATIRFERFYGFADAGGLAGSFEGYETREAAFAAVAAGYDGDCSDKPENLGAVSVCILSGREYVKQLDTLDESQGVAIFGRFVSCP